MNSFEEHLLLRAAGLFRIVPGTYRRVIQVSIDIGLVWVALAGAKWMQPDLLQRQELALGACILFTLIYPLSVGILGGYSTIWRYFNAVDSLRLTLSTGLATALLFPMSRIVRFSHGSLSPDILLQCGALYLLLALGIRGLRRLTYEASGRNRSRQVRALLIGTDNSLASAVREMKLLEDIEIVGMLCPDPELQGLMIGSYPVLGRPEDLYRLLKALHIKLLLIAETGLPCIRESVIVAMRVGVDVHLIPSAANVLRNEVHVAAKPRPEEILARSSEIKAVTHKHVVDQFRGRGVLITGAGGSIGSELCRQVLQLPIRHLVLLDQDENSIFEMMNELRAAELAPVSGVVGDVRDCRLLQRVFQEHQPEVVLHAAAYKHVPVMEENVSAAVLNNVVATRELASAAVRYGAERFLMISSDKAVNPSSVMGCTKRIAEMIVHSIGQRADVRTRCACVRFGNVIGSRGSVLPIFMRQISHGLPVTITDDRMTRYFMTIPEAVELVLQASTLGSHGNLYMLDMGQPVPIRELAERVIHMSGLRAGQDIPIVKIGARAGEKLHEELWNIDAEVTSTQFGRVYEVIEDPVADDFTLALRRLEEAALDRDEKGVSEALKMLPINFHPVVRSQSGHTTLSMNAE